MRKVWVSIKFEGGGTQFVFMDIWVFRINEDRAAKVRAAPDAFV